MNKIDKVTQQQIKDQVEILFGRMYINRIFARLEDRFEFWEDYTSGRIKARIYRYNGIIDVVTE